MTDIIAPTETHVRVPKTAEVVADTLRRQIVRGEIPEGAALPGESLLMEHFGVSRPSLREALRILESERLITVRRGAHGGARACRPTVSVAANYLGLLMQMDDVTLADVYIARMAIEPVAVRMLAGSPDRAQAVGELRHLLKQEELAADDPDAYYLATVRFHQKLVALSGNKTLALLWGTLQAVIAGEVRNSASGRPAGRERIRRRQQAVTRGLDLIEAGEADEAWRFWREEMLHAGERVLRKHGDKTVVDVLV